jgi:hypothetical protein
MPLVTHAFDKPEGTIFLIPLRLENCPLDDRLSSQHWVDLFEPGGYELFVRALSSHLLQNAENA